MIGQPTVPDHLIIQGITQANKTFRPSDWVERIASLWAAFGHDRRLRYSPAIYPCIIDNQKCLVLAKGLQLQDPAMFQFVLEFAACNGLRIQEDRRDHLQPVSKEQRREPWSAHQFKAL